MPLQPNPLILDVLFDLFERKLQTQMDLYAMSNLMQYQHLLAPELVGGGAGGGIANIGGNIGQQQQPPQQQQQQHQHPTEQSWDQHDKHVSIYMRHQPMVVSHVHTSPLASCVRRDGRPSGRTRRSTSGVANSPARTNEQPNERATFWASEVYR